MNDWMREILRRYGQEVSLVRDGASVNVRAFLQPLPESRESLPGTPSGIGWVDRRLWCYLGLCQLFPGETLLWNGLRFRVRSCRAFFLGEHLCHHWAALIPEREVDA